MILVNDNHPYSYDTENLAEIFFPYEKIEIKSSMPRGDFGGILVYTGIKSGELRVSAYIDGKETTRLHTLQNGENEKLALSRLFYGALSAATGDSYPWGILYGVRPAKFYQSLVLKKGAKEADETLRRGYLVGEEKLELLKTVAKNERRINALSSKNSFSLYVSIPFCPTRCSYCSFVSHSIENAAPLLDEYVELLCKELESTAQIARSLGLRLETVYFGGGTPTTLSAPQLKKLLFAVEKNFDLSSLREYTVEAGRPDTVTREKLEVLRDFSVGRISINPQTFNDDVLAAIGRRHTCKDTLRAYELAHSLGCFDINTDLIAALPGDSPESFEQSVQKAISLSPSNITVHTLCLKTGAFLTSCGMPDKALAADMVRFACGALSQSGYIPYYMYRQGKSVGNLENTGWCVPGRECLYNVFMMDETHTVLACGAGGVTRLRHPESSLIQRIYNYKYPYEYIGGFSEMLARKSKITEFYKK